MRRAGFTGEQRDQIKRAFKYVYRSGRNLSQALAQRTSEGPWSREAEEFFEFAATAAKRGICGGARSADASRESID
jgi:UDP-N-acetylglucosamine acyltransferase